MTLKIAIDLQVSSDKINETIKKDSIRIINTLIFKTLRN